MPLIELTTEIAAPIERVFDLARSIHLHVASTAHTGEQAIAGVTAPRRPATLRPSDFLPTSPRRA